MCYILLTLGKKLMFGSQELVQNWWILQWYLILHILGKELVLDSQELT